MLGLLCAATVRSAKLPAPRTRIGLGRARAAMAAVDGDDAFDMAALNRRILSLQTDMSIDDDDESMSLDDPNAPKTVFVLIFNIGSNNEGIYSLHIGAGEEQDVVVGWEVEEDAREYGVLLEETHNMPLPTPKALSMADIASFCQDSGHLLGLVREGVKVEPPSRNVDQFDWSPNSDLATAAEPPSREADGTFTEDQLDSIRLRLERATQMLGSGPAADDRDEDNRAF